ARARTTREPPRPAMVPFQRFAPAGKRRRRGLTSEQFRFAPMTPPARLWQAQAGGRLMSDMGRREVIAVLGGAAAAWPLRARATAIPVIGFVNGRSPDVSARIVAAFLKGLNETGYVEGQNVMVDYHWLDGRYDRLPL